MSATEVILCRKLLTASPVPGKTNSWLALRTDKLLSQLEKLGCLYDNIFEDKKNVGRYLCKQRHKNGSSFPFFGIPHEESHKVSAGMVEITSLLDDQQREKHNEHVPQFVQPG